MISLRIEPSEPITGTITTEQDDTSTRFCGWMELIAAITAARTEPRQPTAIDND